MINEPTIEALSEALLAHMRDDDACTMPLVVNNTMRYHSTSTATIKLTGCIGGHATVESSGVFGEYDLELFAGYLLAAARAIRKERAAEDAETTSAMLRREARDE